jgi:predicted glycoside hydrolase/deacetylase ChbG (UPF0249 family)
MNPALKKLGFGEQDRVVIIHTDDIGMCQSTITAYEHLLDFGLVSSASTMVPCPWFPAVVRFCRTHDGVDMGVHLTLNSEWETYRWGPISTRDRASGLLDEQGYFFSHPRETVQQARPADVATELRAQLERALAAGIDVTHIDSHMLAATMPPFLQSYIDLALAYRLPLALLRASSAFLIQFGLDADQQEHYMHVAGELEERGIPLFDAVMLLPLDGTTDHIARTKALVDALQPGLTYLVLHPAVDTPELRACAPDWPSRVANYEALSSREVRDYIRQVGVQVIGYRPLRDLVRTST